MELKKTNAIRLLEQNNISYELVPYQYADQDLSVEKIAENNGLPLEQIYKTLVLKGNKTGVVIAVVPGNKVLDFKLLARASGNKKVSMASVKEIQDLTGYIRGGCSPLGMKKTYPVFIDQSARMMEKIYVNAGMRGLLFGLRPMDLLEISNGNWCVLTKGG